MPLESGTAVPVIDKSSVKDLKNDPKNPGPSPISKPLVKAGINAKTDEIKAKEVVKDT